MMQIYIIYIYEVGIMQNVVPAPASNMKAGLRWAVMSENEREQG